jgi:ribosome-associated protein
MDIKKLQRTIVDALEDVKAQDIVVFNTTGLTTLFDRVLIATASSNRQTRALASRVGEKVKAAGGHVISTEGLDTGEWVLVDLGDAVVHIMQPAIRAYYKLEEIWGGKPVRMVLGGGRPARPEAEPEPEPEEVAAEEPAPAARKTAARKPAAKTPARSGAKPAARSAAKPAARSAKSAKSAKSARPAKSAGSAPRRAAGKTAKPAAKPRARKTAAKRAG